MRTLPVILATAVIAATSAAALTAALLPDRGNGSAREGDLETRIAAIETQRTAQAASAPATRGPALPIHARAVGAGQAGATFEATGEQETQALATMERYQRAFAAEPIAAAWANATELAVVEALRSPEAVAMGVQLPRDIDVQCRTSLCRVQAAYDDDASAEDAATLLAMDIGGTLPRLQRSFAYRPDGSVEVTLFAMR